MSNFWTIYIVSLVGLGLLTKILPKPAENEISAMIIVFTNLFLALLILHKQVKTEKGMILKLAGASLHFTLVFYSLFFVFTNFAKVIIQTLGLVSAGQ